MKKSSKIIITLLVLIFIAVLAFGLYFIWELSDKVAEQDNKIATLEDSDGNSVSIENSIKNEVATNDNIMSNDEAYELGKDMYNKIVNFSYEEGEFNTEDGMSEILNISELKEITTEDVFQAYLTETEIAVEEAYDGSYWNVGSRGTDISYLNYWTIKVTNISENEINYEVTESYIKNLEDSGKDISELNNDELIMKTNKFVLIKENNIWKVSEFTYPK